MNQQRRAAVTNQLLQTLGRLCAVQRQVNGTEFEHCQQADHPFHRAVQAQRNGHARLDVLRMQVAGELVTALFKFIKAQHLLANAQRGLATADAQALLPQAEEVVAGKIGALLSDRQRHCLRLISQTLVSVHDQCLHQSTQRIGHTLDGLRLEQVGGVSEITAYAARRVGEVEGQIKACIAAANRKLIDSQARHTLPAVVGRQHVLIDLELEQRVVAQITLGCQRIHQMFKGQLLMRLGTGHDLFHLIQQLRKALLLIHLHTQYLSVDEEADQAFQLAAGAPGVGRTNANVGLTTETRQHHRQRRQSQHEQGLAAIARQGFQLRGQLFRHIDAHRRATLARLQRTLVIQRQAQ
ncbi:Uncharacterized protein AC516_4161 [Pseudomonas amygdali pv. sesami]|nr:Uncharacterized protein AC516_4161 [Pseudomonas amygdali pv. sesami]